MEKVNEKIKVLVEALQKARAESLKYKGIDDGGTCNFDCPIIRLERWRHTDIEKVNELAGGGVKLYKWDGHYYNYHICGVGYGQGNRRTKMAEVFYKSMEESGYKVSMYYQMD